MGYLIATCKDCSKDFDTAEMVWLKGYTCEPCYRVAVKNSELKTEPYCGDCLVPINECHHGKGNK